jgi:GT2 family glycosyltransferase
VSRLGAGTTPDPAARLVAPAAVRIVDLDGAPADLRLWSARLGIAYRSLLAVARLDGEPLGAVAVPVSAHGLVSGDWLAKLLCRELESDLCDARARQGLDMPDSLPREGIPGRSHDGHASVATQRSVSVVVTTSRDLMSLERCLRSILACDHPDFEVLVVENRPRSHATTRMLDQRFHDEPRLRYVEQAGVGVSRARNAGLARATGEVVMFTSDDVIVDPGWIRRCGEAFDRDESVACVTGLILPLELETDSQLLAERFVSLVKGFRGKAFRLPQGRVTHPFLFYTPGVMGSGANTALRADVARQLGGFDATLGPGTPALGGEDLDVYVRLLQAGHTVDYDPSVIAWQEHPDGLPQLRRQVLRHGVAMGAALTKQFTAGPERLALVRAVPAGVRYELDPSAHRDARKGAEQRRRLEWLWRLGMALGPAAYAASALRSAPTRRSSRRASSGPQRTATGSDRALVTVAVAACVVAPALVATGLLGELRLPAVLALLCLAPGTALVIALGNRAVSAEPGLVLGASLGLAAVLAQTMLWLDAWWPKAFLYLLAAGCLFPLLVRLREPAARRTQARSSAPSGRAIDDARRDAPGTWVTEVELAAPVSDLRSPPDPSGARVGRARVLVRLHRQPIGFVELPLQEGTLGARDLLTAVDAQLSPALAAHLARDGLHPVALTPDGLPNAESPACAAPGFYGDREPFVSVIFSAPDGNGAGPPGQSLESVLGVDYPSFEVVVARAASSKAADGSRELGHPQLRYVYEPLPDPWKARRRGVGAARGDVLVFIDSDMVVDANWLRALVRGLTPAARVGCVTGPVVAAEGNGVGTGVNFAASREALDAVGAFDGIVTPSSTRGTAHDALIPRFLLGGWAVSHEPAAMAWRLPARARGRVGVLTSVASRFTRSTHVRSLRRWLGRERAGVSDRSRVEHAAAHATVLVAAGVAWGLSLRQADLSRMGGLGLLDAMPAAYFIAFGLLLAGFTAAVSRPALPNRLLWLYAVALILVLHGTTALLYDEPRYTWTYKHLGVIALIAHTGAVDRSTDIYNNWPGFFALAAWLSSVTGVSAAGYAAWAQVFFNLANVVALRFALRGVTSDERLLWTATLFFVLGNWLGQDYLAPQAFAFVLSLVVLGLCLRCGPAPRPPRSRAARWSTGALEGLRSAVLRRAPVDGPPRPAPLSPPGAVLVGALCYLAVVVSHQLTPVILLASVASLALIARRLPLWVPVAMGIAEVWWLWRGWPYLSEHFSLFDPAPSSSAAPPGYGIGGGLPGLALVAYAVRAEVVILVILAAVGLVRRLRAGHWDLAAALLVVAPLVIVGLQSYGGEGRYRVYLFALPWLSFFAAAACTPTRARLPTLTHRARLTLASASLGICLLFAYFGLELMNRVDSDDVAAATWFERHAPTDSVLVGVTTNFPDRVSARYAAVYDPAYPGAPSLTDHAAYRRRKLGVADLPRIERTLRGYGAPHTFLTLGSSQERYARLYGLLPDGSLQSLDRALRASPSFHLVYRRGPSSIFEYRLRRGGRLEAIR